MSCFIVAKGHIDALVQALAAEGLIPLERATEVGKLLTQANNDSFTFNYEGRHSEDLADVESYRFEGIESPLDDAIIANLVECYDYQSCEHDDWKASEAYRLTHTLADLLAGRYGFASAYEYAKQTGKERGVRIPWVIETIQEAAA